MKAKNKLIRICKMVHLLKEVVLIFPCAFFLFYPFFLWLLQRSKDIQMVSQSDLQPPTIPMVHNNNLLVTIGLACGIDYPDYDYLYFPILHPDYYNHTVCVKNCPKGISLFNNLKSLECKTNHLI